MIPLHDTNRRSTFPIVNYLIIVSNSIVFALQLAAPDIGQFIMTYGFVPQQFSVMQPSTWLTVLSSMWMHGGFLHIIFNMWFLHIFGDNVEDAIGHIRYLLFYVFCGVAAVGAQYMMDPTSSIPLIGASGAIAGVTGAYLKLFRNARIVALVPSFFGLWHRIVLPSWFFWVIGLYCKLLVV
ncbi:MAG: Rhomboid family protein [Microgenomates bacterium OLB23]|nr:MAG: Rhomboid family protein [Microgenomates bacterium OLB23]